jgi:group II intron reverse transcriptase/maturase
VKFDQLQLVFADSPSGGKSADKPDVSGGRAFLLHIASARKVPDFTAPAAAERQLLDEVASASNLATALLHVARNKGAAGVDGKSVEEAVADASRLLPLLRDELLSGRYRPGDVRRVWIPKPGGGQRGLGIPNVVDRWVQQAVHQVLAPVFEPSFHNSSHGFRPGRGAGTALPEASEYIAEGRIWVMGVDLSKFFDRVNHQRLLARMSQRISDGRLLRLVHQMLKAKVVLPDGTRVSTEEGTPQGGPLSPLLSNIVLDELDWEMERRGLHFVRYADDFNVYVWSRRAGQRVMAGLTRFIEGRMRLKVNTEKSELARSGRIHFLGFNLFPRRNGSIGIRLSARSRKRINTKILELTPQNWGGSLDSCFAKLNRYLKGWFGYFRLVTEAGSRLFKRFDAHIRRRIRAIIVRQKKRDRFLARHLKSCGVSHRAAAQSAYCSRGPWWKSNSAGMTQAYPNTWFHAGRLVSLWTCWEAINPPATVSGQFVLDL